MTQAPPPTAIIVSAGRGSRLLPLTEAMPKCLVPVGGRAILDHQLDALDEAGVARAIVVAGYRADQVEAHLVRRRREQGGEGVDARMIFNPFWDASSSIASVWAAHTHAAGPFMLMNGDTVFEGRVIAAALAAAEAREGGGVNLAVERPPVIDGTPAFELDDMRVAMDGDRVTAVAKTLADDVATHRSLGLIVSLGADGGGYVDALRRVIDAPGGLQAYHHDVIDLMAREGGVHAIEIAGGWREIDRPQDIAAWSVDHPDAGSAAA